MEIYWDLYLTSGQPWRCQADKKEFVNSNKGSLASLHRADRRCLYFPPWFSNILENYCNSSRVGVQRLKWKKWQAGQRRLRWTLAKEPNEPKGREEQEGTKTSVGWKSPWHEKWKPEEEHQGRNDKKYEEIGQRYWEKDKKVFFKVEIWQVHGMHYVELHDHWNGPYFFLLKTVISQPRWPKLKAVRAVLF